MDEAELDDTKVEAEKGLRLLDNPEFIRWSYEPITEVSLLTKSNKESLAVAAQIERNWGNTLLGRTDLKQWTTKLCQSAVMEALIQMGRKNVRNTTNKKSSIRDKAYEPDLECDEFVYEVKGRSWCTPGTAGEKILGVPLKYGEIPSLYEKPLRIVLVGYQEYEARAQFAFGDLLDSSNQTKELRESLEYFKNHGIEYVAFTDMLRALNLEIS